MRQKVGRDWVDMGPRAVLPNPLSGGPLQTRSQRFTTSCIHGHVRTAQNTSYYQGGAVCLICKHGHQRERRAA